jgi:hypothetical protein
MNVTDPHEGPFLYDGETVTVEAQLTASSTTHASRPRASRLPPTTRRQATSRSSRATATGPGGCASTSAGSGSRTPANSA